MGGDVRAAERGHASSAGIEEKAEPEQVCLYTADPLVEDFFAEERPEDEVNGTLEEEFEADWTNLPGKVFNTYDICSSFIWITV